MSEAELGQSPAAMAASDAAAPRENRAWGLLKGVFISRGILPFVLIGCILLFGLLEPRFLGGQNIFNIARNSTYLIVVCMGQMLALLIRGIDMAVGSTVALVSVVTALVMTSLAQSHPDAVPLAIAAGMASGIGVGILIGLIHGIGIAVFNVNAFIMTVGMMSMAFGLALKLSGGMPVYGMPRPFANFFAYTNVLGVPMPVILTAAVFGLLYFLLNWTRLGRHIYAIGGNRVAAHLAGIRTTAITAVTYVLCSTIVAFGGVLLTARVETGEATMGATMVIESITAVVIAGVSFFGGIGKVGNVVLGAVFVTLVTNGMNLTRVDSYMQQVVLGALLILAVVSDQIRMRMLRQRAPE